MEMILVLGIIAVLLGSGAFMMKNVFGDAEMMDAKADVKALESSLVRYRTYANMFPTQQQGLEALVTRPSDGPQPRSWKQLIEPSGLFDPWQTPYQYRTPGVKNPDSYDVFSMGPDRQEGTDDDIGNWEG